jgi:hypothetical protein
MRYPSVGQLLTVSALSVLLISTAARAEFYKYTDDTGAMVMTNRLEDVPKKYRKRVKVIWDDELSAKDPLARRQAASEAARSRREEQKNVEAQKTRNDQPKPQGTKTEGKTLVITLDEETGQIRKTWE